MSIVVAVASAAAVAALRQGDLVTVIALPYDSEDTTKLTTELVNRVGEVRNFTKGKEKAHLRMADDDSKFQVPVGNLRVMHAVGGATGEAKSSNEGESSDAAGASDGEGDLLSAGEAEPSAAVGETDGEVCLRVLSWNIPSFSTKREETIERRVRLLALTIRSVKPTVLFIQEVIASDCGREAIALLVAELNDTPGLRYRFTTTDVVSTTAECYAIIWDPAVLGEAPPEVALWTNAKIVHTDPFAELLQLKVPSGVFRKGVHAIPTPVPDKLLQQTARAASTEASEPWRFLRSPAFARFRECADERLASIVFGTVHAPATEGAQARDEVCLLLALLGAANAPVVIAGDFNTDQAKTGLWNKQPSTAVGDRFFKAFGAEPIIPWGHATNLYPVHEHKKHNDEIFLSEKFFERAAVFPSADERKTGADPPELCWFAGRSGSRGNARSGVAAMPQDLFEECQTLPFDKKHITRAGSNAAKELYSDHRAVWADVVWCSG